MLAARLRAPGPRQVGANVSTPDSGSKRRSWPTIVSPSDVSTSRARESAHHAVAASTVPDQCAARLEHARELGDDARVVARIEKEAERREQVHDRVEPARPARGQPPHVAARVAQRRPRPALLAPREQITRVVEPVDIVARLGEQMGVASLAARHVQDPRCPPAARGDRSAARLHAGRAPRSKIGSYSRR